VALSVDSSSGTLREDGTKSAKDAKRFIANKGKGNSAILAHVRVLRLLNSYAWLVRRQTYGYLPRMTGW